MAVYHALRNKYHGYQAAPHPQVHLGCGFQHYASQHQLSRFSQQLLHSTGSVINQQPFLNMTLETLHQPDSLPFHHSVTLSRRTVQPEIMRQQSVRNI